MNTQNERIYNEKEEEIILNKEKETDISDPSEKKYTEKDIEDIANRVINEKQNKSVKKEQPTHENIEGYVELLVQGIIQTTTILCCCNLIPAVFGILTIIFAIHGNTLYQNDKNKGSDQIKTAKILCIAGWVILGINILIMIFNMLPVPKIQIHDTFPNGLEFFYGQQNIL